MADAPPNESRESSEPVVAAPTKHKRRWKWPLILLGIFVVLPAVVFTLWTWFALSYSYSEGRRAGYVQKISKKGWVCPTWEGELSMVNIPGAAQERWYFSVRSDSIAQVITNSIGNRVSLQYEEHRGVPTSCFGETSYFITGVQPVTTP